MACGKILNPYVEDLCRSLRSHEVSVDLGLEQFWLNNKDYDIVHIQWPEALFEWEKINWIDLRALFYDALPKWRKSAKIIITRHNELPHDRTNKYWNYLYEKIYNFSDGVIHLGEYGVSNFTELTGIASKYQTIIPHHISKVYGEQINKKSARKILSLPTSSKIILAFGNIRNINERKFLLKVASELPIRNKVLIAPNFGNPIRPSRRKLFQWLLWEIKNREIIWPRKLYLGKTCIPEDKVKIYFSAADIVLVPRLKALNSGIIPLSYKFGNVVVGPNVGNIGLILKNTGNPAFDPSSTIDCVHALEIGFERLNSGIGEKNKKVAKELWSRGRIGLMHKKFYNTIINGYE